jgi:ankyrin repeat protein
MHGHTCLMKACYKGHFKIAKYLIDIGADVNRKSVSQSPHFMKLLITSGARIDVDAYGITPLLAASVAGIHYDYTIEQRARQVPVSTEYNKIGQKS